MKSKQDTTESPIYPWNGKVRLERDSIACNGDGVMVMEHIYIPGFDLVGSSRELIEWNACMRDKCCVALVGWLGLGASQPPNTQSRKAGREVAMPQLEIRLFLHDTSNACSTRSFFGTSYHPSHRHHLSLACSPCTPSSSSSSCSCSADVL
jgi:hypothetical protein